MRFRWRTSLSFKLTRLAAEAANAAKAKTLALQLAETLERTAPHLEI
jgi:hypothetical protein